MKAVTLELQDEHILIERYASILDWTRTRLESGVGIDDEFLSSMLQFLSSFIISCHFAKEELYIFPVLKKLTEDVRSLEGELEADHATIRSLADRLKSSLEAGDATSAAEAMGELSLTLRRHQDKENSVAFAYVEMYTGDDEKDSILSAMSSFDKRPECDRGAAERLISYMFSVIEG